MAIIYLFCFGVVRCHYVICPLQQPLIDTMLAPAVERLPVDEWLL